MRISDWSSDVCSSDLGVNEPFDHLDHPADMFGGARLQRRLDDVECAHDGLVLHDGRLAEFGNGDAALTRSRDDLVIDVGIVARIDDGGEVIAQQPVEHIEHDDGTSVADMRSEEHTSELQSLLRISYA